MQPPAHTPAHIQSQAKPLAPPRRYSSLATPLGSSHQLLSPRPSFTLAELEIEEGGEVMRRLSDALQASSSQARPPRTPPPSGLPLNIAALRGDLSRLRAVLTAQPHRVNDRFSFLTPQGPLLSAEEEGDRFYHPPPLFPRTVKAALAVVSEGREVLSRDQRWLIDHGFAGSTLLHYACVGDQEEVVRYLVDDLLADTSLVNDVRRPADFYTTNDNIRRMLYAAADDSSSSPPVRETKSKAAIEALLGRQRSTSTERSSTPPPAAPPPSLLAPPSQQPRLLRADQPAPLVRENSVSEREKATNRVSRRLSRVISARRLSSNASSAATMTSGSMIDNETLDTATVASSATRTSAAAFLAATPVSSGRPLSQRLTRRFSKYSGSDLEAVREKETEKRSNMAGEESAKEEASGPQGYLSQVFSNANGRPPVVLRRLSVQGGTLESAFLLPSGDGIVKAGIDLADHETDQAVDAAQKVRQSQIRMKAREGDSRKLSELPPDDLDRIGNFSTAHFRSLQELANQILHQNSEASPNEDLVEKYLRHERLLKMVSTTAPPSSTHSSSGEACWQQQSPPSLEALPYRVMLWRRAGQRLNEGLYDGGDPARRRQRKQTLQQGIQLLRQAFRSYATRDRWEALDEWLEKTNRQIQEEEEAQRVAERLRASSVETPPRTSSATARKTVSIKEDGEEERKQRHNGQHSPAPPRRPPPPPQPFDSRSLSLSHYELDREVDEVADELSRIIASSD
eukprot:gene8697-9582_t